jgi:hypothetical protein
MYFATTVMPPLQGLSEDHPTGLEALYSNLDSLPFSAFAISRS